MRIAKAGTKTANGHISLFLNLDGSGKHKIETGNELLDTFLTELVERASIDLEVNTQGSSSDTTQAAIDLASALGRVLEITKNMDSEDSENDPQSDRDKVTSLLTRPAIEERLCGIINETSRFHYAFSMIMIHVEISTENGTVIDSTRNELLQFITKILQESLRSYDVAGRFEDTQFILILPHCVKDNAITISQRLREKIDKLHNAMFQQVSIKSAFGVTSVNDILEIGCSEGISMLDTANNAMKRAKSMDESEPIFYLGYIK
jgi:diguanylate cyclase (GGDEF)-like protein